jgi:hypothetical protein
MHKLILMLICLLVSLSSFSQTKEDVDKQVNQEYVEFFNNNQDLTFYCNEHDKTIVIGCIIQSENIITQKKIKKIIETISPYAEVLRDEYLSSKKFIYNYQSHKNPDWGAIFRINADTCIRFSVSGIYRIDLIDNYRVKLSFEIRYIDARLLDNNNNIVGRFNNNEWVRKHTLGVHETRVEAFLSYPFCRHQPQNLKMAKERKLETTIPEAYNFNSQAEIFVKTHNKLFEWFEIVEKHIINQ